MEKANKTIVIFALLISPNKTSTVHFYQKIDGKFIPVSTEEMFKKTIADIIGLTDTFYYELKKVKDAQI